MGAQHKDSLLKVVSTLVADPDIHGLLHKLTEQFLSSGTGIPSHQAVAFLGKKRSHLATLAGFGVIHNVQGSYYPGFLAFEYETADPRNHVRRCASAVLFALKDLFAKDGYRAFSAQEIHEVAKGKDTSVTIEMVAFGMWMAMGFSIFQIQADFHGERMSNIARLSVRGAIVEFESLEQAWQQELNKRETEFSNELSSSQRAPGSRDSLIGVFDRGEFDRALASSLAMASPEGPLGLLLLDVDYFKQVNDSYALAIARLRPPCFA